MDMSKVYRYHYVSGLPSPLASFTWTPHVTRQNVSFCSFVWENVLKKKRKKKKEKNETSFSYANHVETERIPISESCLYSLLIKTDKSATGQIQFEYLCSLHTLIATVDTEEV